MYAKRHVTRVAVLFLDLDGFKHINDSLGHSVGDRLLQSIGKRLVDCGRAADTISRQGGDEFVVLLSEIHRPEDAAIAAARMLTAVAAAHAIDQHELHVTTSIGVSVYPDDGADAEELIKNADTAMYQAKENGRDSYQYFKPVCCAQILRLREYDCGHVISSRRRASSPTLAGFDNQDREGRLPWRGTHRPTRRRRTHLASERVSG